MGTYSEGTTFSHTSFFRYGCLTFSVLLSPKIQIVVNLCTYPADIPTPDPQLGTAEGEYPPVWAMCPGGVLLGIFGGGVLPASPNPDPISD